jgi:hypothetical protein
MVGNLGDLDASAAGATRASLPSRLLVGRGHAVSSVVALDHGKGLAKGKGELNVSEHPLKGYLNP